MVDDKLQKSDCTNERKRQAETAETEHFRGWPSLGRWLAELESGTGLSELKKRVGERVGK